MSRAAYQKETTLYLNSAGILMTETTVRNAADVCIAGLISDGIFAKLDRLYLNLGSTIAKAAYCCKSRVARTNVNGVTLSNQSSQYNGTTNYFRGDLHLNAGANVTASSACMFAVIDPLGPVPSGTALLGAATSSSQEYLVSATGVA